MEQYPLEQIYKGTGPLEDIFTHMSSVNHDRIFYAAGVQAK